MKKPSYWMSKRLERHQNKLRQRALKERDEDKRKDYWSLYYEAKAIEHEFREKQMTDDIVRLVEVITVLGAADVLLEEAQDNPPPEDEPDKPDDKPPDHSDDIPPRQMGLWD